MSLSRARVKSVAACPACSDSGSAAIELVKCWADRGFSIAAAKRPQPSSRSSSSTALKSSPCCAAKASTSARTSSTSMVTNVRQGEASCKQKPGGGTRSSGCFSLGVEPRSSQACVLEQAAVSAGVGIAGGEQFVAEENRICARHEAQQLGFVGEAAAAC